MTNIILTVGLGDNGTIIKGVIADGNLVYNVSLSKKQTQEHIAVLQRHVDLIPDDAIWHPPHPTLQ